MRKREKKTVDPEELEKEAEETEKQALEEMPEDEVVEAVEDLAKEERTLENEVELDTSEEIKRLTFEIETLRAELEAKKRESERIFTELAEFASTFPKRSIDSITNEVWESMRSGVPLAAAYALYEKKRDASEGYAREVNRRNADRSSGAISSGADTGYFSPSEVKKMTPSEVKKNYRLIIESMKKWN